MRRPTHAARPSPKSTHLHPLPILRQILALQTLYYTATTALILFTTLTAGRTPSIDLILNWRSLRGDTANGWTLGLCWLLGGGFFGYVAQPHSFSLHSFPFLHHRLSYDTHALTPTYTYILTDSFNRPAY